MNASIAHPRQRVQSIGPLSWTVRFGSLLLLLGLLALAACGRSDRPSPNDLPIAVIGPMTGPVAFQGKAAEEAAQMAIDEVNASGGVAGRRLRLLVLDDQNDPAVAAQRAEEAAAAGAFVVLGHRSSDACVAAGKVYRERGLAAITGSATAPEITRGNPWYFRMIFDNDYQGRFLAAYARRVMGHQRATIVFAKEASGKGRVSIAWVKSGCLLADASGVAPSLRGLRRRFVEVLA